MKVRTRVADEEAGGRPRMWALGAMALMLAAVLLLASCGQEQEGAGGEESVPTGEEEESAGQAIGVSVADVTDNPDELYGKQITLSGLVTEVVGPNAVAIGGDEFIGGEPVLILGAKKLPQIVEGLPEGEPFEVQQQDLVQATGTLREFNVSEVENDIGYELDDNLFSDWEGEPVLVADSFVLSPQQDETTTQQGIDVGLPIIVDEPEEFYGQNVTVSGAVAQIIDPNSFVIVDQQAAQDEELFDADSGTLAEQGVLVTTSGGTGPNLTERMTVQVTGTLQQFDAATFEQELGIGFEENNEFYSAFAGGPAIVASQIQQLQGGGETTSQ